MSLAGKLSQLARVEPAPAGRIEDSANLVLCENGARRDVVSKEGSGSVSKALRGVNSKGGEREEGEA